MNCPLCNKETKLTETERTLTIRIDDQTFERRVYAEWCPSCEEGFLDPLDIARFEIKVAQLLVSDGGELTPAGKSFVRRVTGRG